MKEVAVIWHTLFNGVSIGFDLFSLSFWLCQNGGGWDKSGQQDRHARKAGQTVGRMSTIFLKPAYRAYSSISSQNRQRAKRAVTVGPKRQSASSPLRASQWPEPFRQTSQEILSRFLKPKMCLGIKRK